MFRRTYKINRDQGRAFFNRRRGIGWARLLFDFSLVFLIVTIPLLAYWQYDALQLTALESIGLAPTATPFAAERAQSAFDSLAAGEIADANSYFAIAVTQQPENVDYLYEYGLSLIELEEIEQAQAVGDQIIELAPDDPRGYSLRASTMVWSDAAASIPVAVTGLERDPEFAPLHAALAIAYTNIGRYQEGLARGALAVQLDPMDSGARRSYSYPLIYTGRYREAIEQLEQAVAINPNLASPYFELAAVYRRLNDEEMAVAIYQRVLEIDPDNARAYLRLCETYAAVGQFQQGQFYCENALSIDPQYASAHRMLGQLQYSRRNYESSIDSFNRCIQYGSEEIECYYIRGLAHYFLGQCDEAWDVLSEALLRVQQDSIKNSVLTGLSNVTVNCAGYQNRALPTAIPPTTIPPTPIGGF